MSSLERQILSKRLPHMPPPVAPTRSETRNKLRAHNLRDYSPRVWSDYYDSFRDLNINGDSFRVYLSGFGAAQQNDATSPVLVLLHGGGYSSLTWCLFAQCIGSLCTCRILAIDLRGHGNTITSDDSDLSAATLTNDVHNVITHMFSDGNIPPLVLIGHSMGGAIAVRCAATLHELMPTIIGLVVIDVVEGTAMDALHTMQSFLRGRPAKFASLENAIEWCVRSGQTRNLESARVSMPGQLKNIITNKPATDEIDSNKPSDNTQLTANEFEDTNRESRNSDSSLDKISEEDETGTETDTVTDTDITNSTPQQTFKTPILRPQTGYSWRIDLSQSEPYWEGWFTDLSSVFLNCEADAKLLLLAGIDRLDRVLTIGQMQGKFQMNVLPKCGHTVQEDAPNKVAEAIATFLIRNKFSQPLSEFERTFPSD